MSPLPELRRVAAYALIIRDGQILLSRLAPRVSREPLWNLPGGGLDHGEDPVAGVLREVEEETGLRAEVDPRARVYSGHYPSMRRGGRQVDYHALRIVYEGWVPAGAPEPRVVEVDGSTVESRWLPLADVLGGRVPVVAWVRDALADHQGPVRVQRLAAYAVIRRADDLLLTRLSGTAAFPGAWTLPGGGVEHGEQPARSLAREVEEECGVACEVGELLGVHDAHFSGTAPSGRFEDFHGVHLVFAARVAADAEPYVAEVDGTTDAVAWVSADDVRAGRLEVLELVRHALDLAGA
jgi:ADP-ribose pyrophosphatase YjhB (NUDIX family)